jgi:uncharacterized glyoxalase superfamily protein PhnB
MPSFVAPEVCYRDPKAALRWLETAFGFEPLMVILDDAGNLMHSEMRVGGCPIHVVNEWSEEHASPATLGGKNTQSIRIQLDDGIDAHCARARAGGAVIDQEPADQFYGDRTYRARDLEGHVWMFGQTVKPLSPAQWDKVGGTITKDRL